MLTIREIHRSFGDLHVLRGVSLDVETGEIICLLGPSGCGKTTLLRVIAGLEQADSGDVLLNRESILNIPVHERDFGLMFQDFALFPHMNVAQNVEFGLKMRGLDRTDRNTRVEQVLELVGLTKFKHNDVSQLSGGERQRVALARSLSPNPRLLMLDEPLGSLDASLRERLVVELKNIIKRVGLTAIYVTHDQQEAYAIADRIAVMNAGKIEQIGTPEAVYRKPKTEFVARFLGLNNIVPVLDFTQNEAKTTLGLFPVEGKPTAILLHPIGLTLNASESMYKIAMRVVECTFSGRSYRLELEHESGVKVALETPEQNPPKTGEMVSIGVLAEALIPLNR